MAGHKALGLKRNAARSAVTHGHLTGALPQLLAKYPDCPVLLHSEEAPFLLGTFTAPYYDPRSAPLKVKFHLWTG